MALFAGTWIVARKELVEHFTSKRLIVIVALFALSIIVATTLGARLFNDYQNEPGQEQADTVPAILNLYLNTFQGILLLKILALVLAADAVVSEWKDRTLFLLLSKPLTRTAMLTGKIVAAYLAVLVVFVAGFTIALAVLLVDLGVPGPEAWGRILGGLAILGLGLLPFVALATMFSTLFKSTATSYAMSIILVMLVLPILLTIVVFIVVFTGDADPSQMFNHPILRALQLIDPSTFLDAASVVMMRGGVATLNGIPLLHTDVQEVVISSFIAMALHLAVYLGISYWVVNRRDYS